MIWDVRGCYWRVGWCCYFVNAWGRIEWITRGSNQFDFIKTNLFFQNKSMVLSFSAVLKSFSADFLVIHFRILKYLDLVLVGMCKTLSILIISSFSQIIQRSYRQQRPIISCWRIFNFNSWLTADQHFVNL